MTETLLGLLRHGQTDWNVDMRLQGISDIPLNEHGRGQALRAGDKVLEGNWDVILTSPLSRAVETARLIRGEADLPLQEHDLLIERSFGIAEGLTYEQWRDRFGSAQEADGAESIEDLTIRAKNLLDYVSAAHQGKRVLAVSHGAFIRRLINIVSHGELPREGERFGNASLSLISHTSEGWRILDFNPAGLGD